ncbi:hypothetical protein Q8A67_022385 [Cirrhinus molitorella]|uniref:Uncharacterized protein n=1 Tax=Cirrhinus molitorella TaxID=172907 RepID=A0AA88P6G3_9TELE|nr:hypothetical protein Q8A67_022385 [Cirrhinus molitorella]
MGAQGGINLIDLALKLCSSSLRLRCGRKSEGVVVTDVIMSDLLLCCFPITYCLPNSAVAGSFFFNLPVAY